MNDTLKILLGAILIAAVFNREIFCEHLGFGPTRSHLTPLAIEDDVKQPENQNRDTGNYWVEDALYHWDDQVLHWIPVNEKSEHRAQLVTYDEPEHPATEPIQLVWEKLLDIRYKLRYFSELDMKIYAPVFPKSIQALDGKEVVIEGFVIPFDEDEQILALSANPYASCFFCGKASPASVMSLYLKKKRKRYKMDDFKTFRGTLHLNHDDPNEYYYILRNATEE
jgi:hypothetical protein